VPAGDRLPAERALARQLGVAVGTLRKALARLAAEGLLARHHGSGNYVAEAAAAMAGPPSGLRTLSGALLSASVIGEGEGAPPAQVSIAAPGPLRWQRLLYRAAGLAVAVEARWAAATAEAPARIDDRVGLSRLPGWAPPALAAGAGGWAGHVHREGSNAAGALLEMAELWFDPGRVRYHARLR
jgi:GntR family transcriptional regulator